MALFTMKLENLEQLFLQELRDLYDAENQITDALPKMIEAAHYGQLKDALQEHMDVTRTQIQRLDPDSDVVLFLVSPPDASGRSFSRLIAIRGDKSPVGELFQNFVVEVS